MKRPRASRAFVWLFAVALTAAAQAADAPKPPPDRVVRVAVVSQRWCDEDRTLEAARRYIDDAGAQGADVVLLPQECIRTDGEAIPGPITDALAERARAHGLYVVGNLREKADGKTFVTSLLLDRSGRLVGTYRKSHKMPDEDMDLGDRLPVFERDFGPVAMRMGTECWCPGGSDVCCLCPGYC